MKDQHNQITWNMTKFFGSVVFELVFKNFVAISHLLYRNSPLLGHFLIVVKHVIRLFVKFSWWTAYKIEV